MVSENARRLGRRSGDAGRGRPADGGVPQYAGPDREGGREPHHLHGVEDRQRLQGVFHLAGGAGPGAAVLLRGDDAPILEEDGGRYRNCPAFPFDGERGFETYRIVMLPGGALEAQPHLPGTEEYVTVFAGEAEIGLRGRPTGSGPATPCASRRTSPTATGTRGRRRLNSVC